MVQKTKKVCIGPLQTHAKSQSNWFKFENLIFDPCVKDKALNFFWDTLLVLRLQDIHSRYKILIVHQSGVSRINLEGSRAEKDRGGHWVPPPIQSRVKLSHPLKQDTF